MNIGIGCISAQHTGSYDSTITFLNESRVLSFYVPQNYSPNQYVSPGNFMYAQVKYFKAGIYFILSAKVQIGNTSTLTNFALEVMPPQGWTRKRPCGSGDVHTSPPGIKNNGTFTFYQFNMHEGSRGLNGYYLKARARATTSSGQVIFTEVTGRGINSPYN